MGHSLLQSAQANITLLLMLSKAQTTQARLSSILDGKCLSLNRSNGGADEARGCPILSVSCTVISVLLLAVR